MLEGEVGRSRYHPYSQLEKKFGTNRQNIIKCSQGYNYRYPKGIPTKVQFTLSKPEAEEEQGATAEVGEANT